MKQVIVYLALWLMCCTAFAQDINKVEYYINTDPGIGNGVNVPISAGATLNNISFDVNVGALADGFHKIHVRVRDANGKWSPTEFRTIYKSSALPPSAEIYDVVAAEYYIDTDPGIGAATPITITPGNIVETMTFDVPVSSLSVGFHTIYIRVKDENGRWSNTQRKMFMKEGLPPQAPATPNLAKIEYYIDTDPGFGNATNVPFTAGTKAEDLVFTIDKGSLTEGNHKLFVRAKDANDKWSLVHTENISFCNFAPTALAAATAITTSGFTLSWNAVANATGYRLDISADDFKTFLPNYSNRTLTSATLTQVVTGVAAGTTVKARVRAVGASCISVNSNIIQVSTLLATPSLQSATNVTASSFDVAWNSITGATGYQLDVSTNNFQSYVQGYEHKEVATNSASVTGLLASTDYQVRVRATKETATSAYSNVQTVKTLSGPVGPVEKQQQTITFGDIPTKTLGGAAFTLNATASSSLEVSFTTSSSKISIANKTVTLLAAGQASVTASQPGNDQYLAAENITRTFCINPAKPTITINNDFTTKPVLTSSNPTGNQWYINGVLIAGATQPTIDANLEGAFTVTTTVDGCASETSSPFVIKITGTEPVNKVSLYPVPVTDVLHVTGLPADAVLNVVDMLGRTMKTDNIFEGHAHRVTTREMSPGTYLLTAKYGNEFLRLKFTKQ